MASSGHEWSFHNGSGWQRYDTSSSDTIEKAFLSKETSVRVNTRSHTYTVDLIQYLQINNSTKTERRVMREDSSDKTLPNRMTSVPYGHKRSISPVPPKSGAYSTLHAPVPPKSGTFPTSYALVPSKSGAYSTPYAPVPSKSVAYSTPYGSVPSKSDMLCHDGVSSSDILYTRATSGPKASGTQPLPTPSHLPACSPVARPRKKYKPEPNNLGAYDTFFRKYTEITVEKKIPKDETCPICLTSLLEPADVDITKKSHSSSLPLNVISGLKKCSHMFHMVCIGTMLDSTPNVKIQELSISCPICQTIHGVRTGDQPLTGTMTVTYESSCVPGYEGYGTIRIKYNFSHGVSETGTNYNAASFPRVCYIPRCPEGEKVLQLLKLAWERRLVFTVATSVTTGCENCVVWNNIHHKTEPHSNTSGHGFPDPNFLNNIKMELAVQGVTEEELK